MGMEKYDLDTKKAVGRGAFGYDYFLYTLTIYIYLKLCLLFCFNICLVNMNQ